MKVWKLVSGIISILLGMMLYIASRFIDVLAAFVSAFTSEKINTGFLVFASFMILAGGICSIVSRNGEKFECIATVVCYGLGAVLGLFGIVAVSGDAGDMPLGVFWSLVCAGVAAFDFYRSNQGSLQFSQRMPKRPLQGQQYQQQYQQPPVQPQQPPVQPQRQARPQQQFSQRRPPAPQPQYPVQQPQMQPQYPQVDQQQDYAQPVQRQASPPQPQSYDQFGETDLFEDFSVDGGEDYNDF